MPRGSTIRGRAWAILSRSLRCAGTSRECPWVRKTACSRTWRSSRTLPGQGKARASPKAIRAPRALRSHGAWRHARAPARSAAEGLPGAPAAAGSPAGRRRAENEALAEPPLANERGQVDADQHHQTDPHCAAGPVKDQRRIFAQQPQKHALGKAVQRRYLLQHERPASRSSQRPGARPDPSAPGRSDCRLQAAPGSELRRVWRRAKRPRLPPEAYRPRRCHHAPVLSQFDRGRQGPRPT